MKTIKLFLLMLLILNIIIVSADATTTYNNGSQTLTGNSVSSYQNFPSGQLSGVQANFSKFAFDVTDFNQFISWTLTCNTACTFTKQSNSTHFTIKTETGNTGDGFVSYSKGEDKIYWLCNNCIIIDSPVSLIYDDPNWNGGINTGSKSSGGNVSTSTVKPVLLFATDNNLWTMNDDAGTTHGTMTTSVSSTYTYSFTSSLDSSTNIFNVNIIKPAGITSKANLTHNDLTTYYLFETTFNTVNVSFANQICDGLVINMRTNSGLTGTKTLFTDAGACTSTLPQTKEPGAGGSPGGQITYDFSTATRSSSYGFLANVTDANYTTFLGIPTRTYYINAYDTGGFLIQGFPISFTSQNYSTGRMWTFSDIGTWQAKLYYCSITDVLCTSGISDRILIDTATITISPTIYAFSVTTDQASYTTGQVINMTVVNPSPNAVYLNMFLSAGGAGQAGSIEDLIVPNGTHYVTQIVSGDMISGQWEVGLYQSPGGIGKLANDLFTIGVSSVGSNVSSIMWGDQYFVGRTNPLYYTSDFFQNTIRVYKVFPGQSTPTQIDSFVVQDNVSASKGYLMDTAGSWSASITNGTGNISWANITVFGKLETGCNKRLPDYVCFDNDTYFTGDSYKIAYKATTFTNSLNAISLRLLVFDPQNRLIQNKTIFFNKLVLSPPYTGEFNANFVAVNPPGKYHAILMIDGTPENVFMDGTPLTDSFAIVISKPVPGATPSNQWGVEESPAASSCTVWDSWTKMILGGFGGLNNTTRFQFALLTIGFVMFFGFVISRKDAGVAIFLGFLPYANFLYLSLAGGCGTYMPTWTAVFLALVIGIKMRWF